MEQNIEIRRLLEIMPASSRMTVKIISKPEQAKVIDVALPLPWNYDRPIYINFDFWRRLTKPQRDMLLLRTVSWLTGVKWFKPDIYQGVAVAGLLGGFVELAQRDVVGIIAAVGLSSMAVLRIWRLNNGQDSEIIADTTAIKIAQRRDYTETVAAEHLLNAIEIVAKIEGRPSLDFIELIRTQNLRATAGLSSTSIPR